MNAFSNWLNSSDIYEQYWGESEAPEMTQEEFESKQLAELVAMINREPQPPNEAADRGTALNDILDALQFGREVKTQYELAGEGQYYRARLNGFEFKFDASLVHSLCLVFNTALPQYHLECEMRTGKGDKVILHGYPDYIFPTMIWDLKTTNKYSGEKYRNNWQRFVYPVAAMLGGAMTRCETFTFYALEMRKERAIGVLTAKPFTETYDVEIDDAEARVREFIESVMLPQLDWLETQGMIPNNNIITEG